MKSLMPSLMTSQPLVYAAVTFLAAGLSASFSTGAAMAAEIQVMCPPPMHAVLAELAPTFEAQSGHKLAITFIPSVKIIERLKSGETPDVVLLTSHASDGLIKEGKLASRVDVARSTIGVAVKSGSPKPDVSSAEAFKKTLLAAESFARNEGADSGLYMKELIERVGLTEQIKAKTKLVYTGYVAELVARGEVALGAQQVAELMSVPGVDVTPLGDDIQHVLVFSAGRPAASREPAAAQALVDFLRSPTAAAVIRKKGHFPASGA